MNDSPITLAHAHARNAVLETRRLNPVAASEEHDLAAAEFANASQGTGDSEALRTLRLLEEHHKRLGHILKSRHEHPQLYAKKNAVAEAENSQSSKAPSADLHGQTARSVQAPASTPSPTPAQEALQQPPRLIGTTRPSARDLSSSIASNLASARGIPGSQRRAAPVSPTISAQLAPGKFAKEQAKAKGTQDPARGSKLQSSFFTSNDLLNDGKPSWVPPANPPSPAPETTTTSASDAPFQQFYSTLESWVTKISAPLAFASLPLTSNPSPGIGQLQGRQDTPQANTGPELDPTKLISSAALRAVQNGIASSSNPAESFYVVPTTGGTFSYADIMTRGQLSDKPSRTLHSRHPSNLSEEATDDFVDARETLHGPSSSKPSPRTLTNPFPHSNPRPRNIPPSEPTINGKSLEELLLENATLRRTTDTLTKRLHVFEASAQTSSAALAQSIRFLTRSANLSSPPPSSPEHSHGKTTTRDDKERERERERERQATKSTDKPPPPPLPDRDLQAERRIHELEDILRRNDAELTRREKENARLKETVGRYREKWDKLKEGAKARAGRVGGGNGNGVGGGGGAGGGAGGGGKGDEDQNGNGKADVISTAEAVS